MVPALRKKTNKQNNYKIEEENGNISVSKEVLWLLISKELVSFIWGNQSNHLKNVILRGHCRRAQCDQGQDLSQRSVLNQLTAFLITLDSLILC